MTLQTARRWLFTSRTRWVVNAAIFAGFLTWALSGNAYDGLTLGMVVFTCSGLNVDNVVYMAPFIRKLPRLGQLIFLSIGLAVTVVGVEILLPVWIVSAINHTGFTATFHLAIFHPQQYVVLQETSSQFVSAGTYVFLGLLSLTNIMKPSNTVYWWDWAESRLSKWGRQSLAAYAIVGIMMVGMAWLAQSGNKVLLLQVSMTVFVAFFLFKIAEGTIERRSALEGDVLRTKSSASLLLAFVIVLESMLNVDAMAGGYAVTNNFKLVVAGLAVSALVMRALMFDAAKHPIDKKFQYIVVGANWAILWLALMEYLKVFGVAVPEMLVGVGGTAILLAAGAHSHIENVMKARRPKPSQAV